MAHPMLPVHTGVYLLPLLTDVSVPVLLRHGRQDKFVPLREWPMARRPYPLGQSPAPRQ